MKRIMFGLWVVLLLAGGAGPILAQGDGDAPIILGVAGDLWQVDLASSETRQLTYWGYNGQPVISPDGQYVAYNSSAEFAVEQFEDGTITHGTLPANIWLWEISTGDARRLADQPADAAVVGEGAHAFYRGTPDWSPDGSFLAWTEAETPEWQWHLVIYDVTTNAALTLADLPAPYADVSYFDAIPVQWGDIGLAVAIDRMDPELNTFVKDIQVYDLDGNLLGQRIIPEQGGERVLDWFWIHEGSRRLIYIEYASDFGEARAELFDPVINETTSVEADSLVPMLQRAGDSAPVGVTYDLVAGGGNYTWWAVDATARYLLPIQSQPVGQRDRIAPSPDGESFAFITDALYVWQNGQVIQVPGTEFVNQDQPPSVVWGRSVWWARAQTSLPSAELGVTPTPPPAAPLSSPQPSPIPVCNPALPTRLQMGDLARVLSGSPNNIREVGGLNGAVIGTIPGDTVVPIVGGPYCGDDITWWIVDYDGVRGWTAEGQGTAYFMEPAS